MAEHSDEAELSHSYEELRTSLHDAISWASKCAYPRIPFSSFRTAGLAPDPLAGTPKQIVDSVIQRRAHALIEPRREQETRIGGRLLVFTPGINLYHGLETVESHGFFDRNNNPPWDLWVAHVKERDKFGYVLSWVPEDFLEIAAAGISISPEECIEWLDETKLPLAERLRQDGIL